MKLTCFGDGDSALFHNLMYSCSVDIAHLIELINTDDTTICQNHRTWVSTVSGIITVITSRSVMVLILPFVRLNQREKLNDWQT